MRYPSAKNMIEALNEAGFTEETIGERLGVTDAAVNHWKLGRNGIRLGNLRGLQHLYREEAKKEAPEAPPEPVRNDSYERVVRLMLRVNQLPVASSPRATPR